MPGRVNGKWEYVDYRGRRMSREKFEEFKIRFYKLQGWDVTSGFPTRKTLESLGLTHVADELDAKSKLGQ